MGVLRLLLRRARAGLGLLATLLLLTAGTTAVVAGTVGYSQAGAIEATREALTVNSNPAESAVSATTRQGADPATQEAVARAAIVGAFSPAPVEVVASELSEPRAVAGRTERLVALSSPSLLPGDPRFRDRVSVLAGRWPAGPDPAASLPVEGALPAGLADAWGVGPGDVLQVGDAEVTVVGTWQPVDPDDPFWLGDPWVAAQAAEATGDGTGDAGNDTGDAGAGGTGDGAGQPPGTGLLIVAPGEAPAAGAVRAVGGDPYLRWTILPDTDRVLPEHLPVLASGAADLRTSMDDPDLVVRGLVVDGDLAPTAARAAEDLAAARALSVVPITVLLLVSVIAVVQITRVQAATRVTEAELLMARGAARRQVLWWTLLEAGSTGLVGTVLGVGLALVALQTVPSGAAQTETVVLVGTGAGAAVLASLLVVNAVQVRVLDAGRSADRSGRGREAVPVAVLVFVVGAGLLALWQLQLYDSPIITTGTGEVGVDALASAAPALLLASAAALTAAGLGPVARSLERLTAVRTGEVAHLAATHVSRRLVVYAAPLALVVLACGTTTIASLYASTAGGLRDDLATLGTGSDIRAPYQGPVREPSGLPTDPAVEGVEGVTGSVPVWRTSSRIGSTELDLTVAPAAELGSTILIPEGLLDPPHTAEVLHTADPTTSGIPIPATADVLTLDVELTATLAPEHRHRLQLELDALPEQVAEAEPGLTGQALEEEITARQQELLAPFTDTDQTMILELYAVEQDSGRLAHLATEPLSVLPEISFTGGTVSSTTLHVEQELRIEIPPGDLATISSLHLLTPRGGGYQADLVLHGVTTTEGTDLLQTAEKVTWEAHETGPLVVHDPAAGELRVLSVTGRYPEPGATGRQEVLIGPALSGQEPPVPVLLSREVARMSGLEIGSTVTLSAWGNAIDGEVVLVADGVPGTLEPAAALVDQGTLQAALHPRHRELPVPTEYWISSDDPAGSAAALRQVPDLGSVSVLSEVAVTDAAAAARGMMWIAAGGALFLAFTGTAAVAVALVRLRRSDVMVFRALGMAPGALARSRAIEVTGVVLTAALIGIGSGWLVGYLVIPEMARSTTPQDVVELPARLRLEWPLWLGSMGGLGAATAGLLIHQGRRIRAQARDSEYREEVR